MTATSSAHSIALTLILSTIAFWGCSGRESLIVEPTASPVRPSVRAVSESAVMSRYIESFVQASMRKGLPCRSTDQRDDVTIKFEVAYRLEGALLTVTAVTMQSSDGLIGGANVQNCLEQKILHGFPQRITHLGLSSTAGSQLIIQRLAGTRTCNGTMKR